MGQKNSLTAEEVQLLLATYDRVGTITGTSRETGFDSRTIKRHIERRGHPKAVSPTITFPVSPVQVREMRTPFLPEPAPEAGGPSLPAPVPEASCFVDITKPGHWLYLSDLHIPHHDLNTINKAFEEGKRKNVVGVLLNGDVLNGGGATPHERFPNETRLEEEIDKGYQFLQYTRSQFPNAEIWFKCGNHELWLPRYIAKNAEALYGLEALELKSLLKFNELKIHWVGDGDLMTLGRLHVLHGHEFRGGGGVNPARWLALRAGATAMCGHFHRTSDHHENAIDGRQQANWSVGCACYLHPQWLRMNKWNHGFAAIEVYNDGRFTVTNRRILRDGQVA